MVPKTQTSSNYKNEFLYLKKWFYIIIIFTIIFLGVYFIFKNCHEYFYIDIDYPFTKSNTQIKKYIPMYPPPLFNFN